MCSVPRDAVARDEAGIGAPLKKFFSAPIEGSEVMGREGALKVLGKIKGKWLLTYGEHPEIWGLYHGFSFQEADG